MTKRTAALGAFGLGMGFVLSELGFSRFEEVHRMFTFADLRLTGAFMGAVVLSALVFHAIAGSRSVFLRPLHRGTIPGGVLFGIGWAVTGACPSVVLVQLGEGQWPALLTAVGVVGGTWLYGWAHARYFRWDTLSCEE